MDRIWSLAALSVATLAWASSGSQEQDHGTLRKLPPVAGGTLDAGAPAQQSTFDEAAWRSAMLDMDLDQREDNFDLLLDEARRDVAALRALEAWAAGDEPELAWTARLALRELSRRPRRMSGFGDPFGKTFEIDPRTGLPQAFSGLGPSQGHTLFDELHRMLSRGVPLQILPAPGGSDSQSKSFELHSGPDGVTVRVEETVDGKVVQKDYKGESLEALLEANPELEGQLGGVTILRPGSVTDLERQLGLGRSRGRTLRRTPSPEPPKEKGAGLRTDVLGVYAKNATAEGGEPGLLVEGTVERTIAHALGIHSGDRLLEMNGRTLTSTEDIAEILKARAAGEAVRIEIVRGGSQRTLTWLPAGDE